jgi:hypothetical protein
VLARLAFERYRACRGCDTAMDAPRHASQDACQYERGRDCRHGYLLVAECLVLPAVKVLMRCTCRQVVMNRYYRCMRLSNRQNSVVIGHVMLKNQDFLCIRSFICTSMTVHCWHAARVVSTAWFLPVVTNAEEQNHRIIKWPSPVRLIADHVAVSFFQLFSTASIVFSCLWQ